MTSRTGNAEAEPAIASANGTSGGRRLHVGRGVTVTQRSAVGVPLLLRRSVAD